MSISANYPTVATSLNLDFANSQQLDPRVSFSRPTTAAYYDANTTALAEQNLVTNSNAFSSSGWVVSTVGTPAQGATAPDGTSTGWTLTATAASGFHNLNYIGLSGAGTYTCSIYLQAGTNNFATLVFNNYASTTNYASVTFNLTAGSVAVSQSSTSGTFSAISSSITQVGSTNWYRCVLTSTTTSTSSLGMYLQLNNSATPTISANYGLQTWTALGTETLLVYGAQLEQRSSVTAYNATTTTAITNYIPVLLTAPTNQARFDHDPVARTSLGLLIEQQSTNLLTYSQLFDNAAWNKQNCSTTTTAGIAPDGTQTAELQVEATGTVTPSIYRSFTFVSGTSYAFSIYAKAAGRTVLNLYNNGGFIINGFFDLSAGTATGTGATITSVGNGWYRCTVSLAASASAAGNLQIAITNATTTYTGNGYSGIYIWGAQLEALAFPTSYIPTVASQVTRSADSASMTGTNFSSWYNPSVISVYVQASRKVTGISNQTMYSFGSSDFFGIYSLGTNEQVYSIALGTAGVVSTTLGATTLGSKKIASSYVNGYFQGAYNGTLGSAFTPANIPANVNAFYLGANSTGSILNGWIQKLSYYPVQLTATQMQSLTGS